MTPLTVQLERSLGNAFAGRAEPIERWMRAGAMGPAALEASVRGGRGAVTGQRMMIERVRPEAVPDFFGALGVDLPDRCAAAATAARELGVPAIVGWDAASRAPVAKLYVNASDASLAVRGRVAEALGVGRGGAPSVVGFNVAARGGAVELKAYTQSAAPPPWLDAALATRFAGLVARGVVSGWVVSRTVDGRESRPRAVFAGLKPGHPGVPAALEALGAWSGADIARVAPFAAGAVTSLGFDAADASAWTVYFKPAGVAPRGWDLEPVVVARDASAEVGVFVEPASLGRRAWATVGAYAVSYRVREGSADPARLAALMGWACARLADGVAPSELGRDARPPEPWNAVYVP